MTITTSNPVSEVRVSDIFSALASNWKLILGASLLVGAIAWGLTFLITPIFTARASFITPQQQQSSAAAALASLGNLSGLAGAAAGIKTPGDQYVSLMESATIRDRVVQRFDLVKVYGAQYPVDARYALGENVRIAPGKKDNLIFVEVDDPDPKRAAEIANAMIEELKLLLNSIALTEAQQRRVFFEKQLADAKVKLGSAQQALYAAGFNEAELKADPQAAAESYARTRAELATAEVKLAMLKTGRADNAPEVQGQLAVISSLKRQLSGMETPNRESLRAGFVSAYRDFKYEETMFEMYAKQFELARLDEAKEGALVQVLDVASPPVRRSKPRRLTIAAAVALLTFLLSATVVAYLHINRRAPGTV